MSDPFQSFSGPSPLMVPDRGTRLDAPETPPGPKPMSPEDLFGPAGTSMEALFPERKMYVGSKPPIEYFNQGFTSQFRPDEPFGIKPLTQAEKDRGAFDIPKFLYDQGILKKADDESRTILNEFNELLILGVPAAVDFTFRGVMGTVYGLSEVMRAGGVPKDLTPAAYLEAFPLARATPGFPARPTVAHGPQIVDLDHAEQLGLTGKRPSEVGREAFAPENAGERIADVPRDTQFDNRLGFAEPERRQTAPPDIDTIARQLNPGVFTQYDDLVSRRQALEGFVSEQLQPDVIRVGGREVAPTTPLSDIRGFNFEETPITRGISPETASLIEDSRAAMREIDRKLLDLSSELTEAYAEAARLTPEERRMPREEETHARARNPEAFDKLYELEDRRDARVAELNELERVEPFEIKEVDQARRLELRKEIADIDRDLREVRPAIEQAHKEAAGAEPITTLDTQRAANILEAEGTITPERLVEALGLDQENATKLARRVLTLAQRGRSIARDTEQRLVAAGRPRDEARLAGQLIKAHFEARAARLGVDARELYEKEAPRIYDARGEVLREGDLGQDAVLRETVLPESYRSAPGLHRYDIVVGDNVAGNVIIGERGAGRAYIYNILDYVGGANKLGPEAIRQIARQYFEQNPNINVLEGDRISGARTRPEIVSITREQAFAEPRQLRQENRGSITLGQVRDTIRLFAGADASTFLHESAHSWLQEMQRDAAVSEAVAADLETVRQWLGATGELTRRQHELFARGFERYMMEGRSPTPALARVFEQFKEWLTQIYQTVARLRAPITDDIRGVYDRLLLKPTAESVIDPTESRRRTFAEEHETAARAEGASEATAERLREERDKAAEGLTEDMDARRRQARTGEEGTGVSGERVATADEPGGAGVAAAAEGERTGRTGITDTTEPPQDSATPYNPVGDRLVDKAGNIRLENLNVDADVAAAIKEAAAAKGGFLEARRGVLSEPETIGLADDMGMPPSLIDRWQVGQTFNAEQIVVVRRLLVEQATRVRDAAARLASIDTGLLGKLTGKEPEVAAYAKERERLMLIQEVVSGVTAEAGRAFRAFRILDQVESKTMIELMQREMGTSPERLRREAELLQKTPAGPATAKAIRQMREPTWKDMFTEVYINSLLSGPYTHIVNFISNASVIVSSSVETAIAAGISKLTRSDAVSFGEIGDRLYGIGQGAVEGIRAAGDILRDETVLQIRQNEGRVGQAVPGIAGRAVRIPTRLLGASDEFFKAIAFQQELNVLARRRARSEGLSGDDLDARIADLMVAPTEAMINAAKLHAEYQTFQTTLGPTGRAIMAFADSHPAVRFILPFIRTPVNIFKYSTERTPFGLAWRSVRDDLGAGGAARDTALARMTMGTTVGTAVGMLAMQGLISGGGPTDASAQETLRQTGWQPYSLRIGDTWWSYRRFDPLANIIGLAADFADIGQYVSANDDEYQKTGAMVITTIWRNLGDKLSLRGVSSMMKALTEPEMNAQTFVSAMAGSLVPFSGLQGQTAGMLDPYVRETRDAMSTFWGYIGNPMLSRVPGARESLFARRDRWGEPATQTDVGPIQTRAVNRDPVNDTMLALGLNKASPERKINGVTLTNEQYDDYARISGRLAKTILDEVVTPEFRTMAPGLQAQAISKIIDSARAYGRAVVLKEAMGTDNDIIQKGIELHMKRLLEDRAPSPFAH